MKKIAAILALSAVIILTACQTEEPKTGIEDLLNDQIEKEVILKAVGSGSLELCETLEIDENRELCVEKINDKNMAEEAKINKDAEKCDEIDDENSKERCKIGVAQELERDNYNEEINKEIEKSEEIEESGNVKDCETLKDANFQKSCRINIYMQEAIEKNDPQICNNIEDEDAKEECKRL